MAERDITRLRSDLCDAVGSQRVRWDERILAEHAHDTWPLSLLRAHQGSLKSRPACVVSPGAAEEVARVLRYANEHRVPVVPFGAGSGVCGGVLPQDDAVVVDLRRMDRLVELNETALGARVQAGMMGDRFEAALNDRGYSMGHFPQSIALSTVGGWVATRAAGQFSTRYGSIEDMLLALEVVLPNGRIIRTKAVPRRSTGPDLCRFFLGSEGTLGIITEISVRVFPRPEARVLSCYRFPDFDTGLDAIRATLRAGWAPPVLRLYDRMETDRHFGQWAGEDGCFLIILSEGPPSLVTAEIDGCHAACEAVGGGAVGDQPVEHWLAERNNVPDLESLIAKGLVIDTIEVAAGWDRIHKLYHDVIRAVGGVKDLIVVSGHSSHSYPQGTNIYFTFAANPAAPSDAVATYLACWEQAMEATLRCGGTISHHHGIGRLRARWMPAEHGDALSVLRAVKRALDPNGIMNPGVLLPDEA